MTLSRRPRRSVDLVREAAVPHADFLGVLTEDLEYGESAEATVYVLNTATPPVLVASDSTKTLVYDFFLESGEKLLAGRRIEARYFAKYGRWYVVNSESPGRWGKLDGDLAAGGTATVSLWQTTGGGWEGWDEDSTEDETAYAWPGQSSTIASGAWVRIVKRDDRWVVDMAACSTTT